MNRECPTCNDWSSEKDSVPCCNCGEKCKNWTPKLVPDANVIILQSHVRILNKERIRLEAKNKSIIDKSQTLKNIEDIKSFLYAHRRFFVCWMEYRDIKLDKRQFEDIIQQINKYLDMI